MTRLLAMLAVSVAMFALPAPARAQEMVVSSSAATVSYPDQWGWVLPVPEGMEYITSGPQVWSDPENRVVVAYYSARGRPTAFEAKTYRFYDLFAGRVLRDLNDPHPAPLLRPDRRYEDYVISMRLREVPRFDFHPPFRLADGSDMRMASIRPSRCDTPINYLLEKVDANGTVLWRRMLLQVSVWPTLHTLGCLADDGAVHSRSLYGSVHALPDGTFLFAPIDQPLVIRFRDEFVSPFLDASDEFLALDPAEVEPILDQAEEFAFEVEDRRDAFLFIDGYMTARLLPLLQAKREKANAK
jgi:hypothetical protein